MDQKDLYNAFQQPPWDDTVPVLRIGDLPHLVVSHELLTQADIA